MLPETSSFRQVVVFVELHQEQVRFRCFGRRLQHDPGSLPRAQLPSTATLAMAIACGVVVRVRFWSGDRRLHVTPTPMLEGGVLVAQKSTAGSGVGRHQQAGVPKERSFAPLYELFRRHEVQNFPCSQKPGVKREKTKKKPAHKHTQQRLSVERMQATKGHVVAFAKSVDSITATKPCSTSRSPSTTSYTSTFLLFVSPAVMLQHRQHQSPACVHSQAH